MLFDEEAFRKFLKRSGRSPSATDRVVRFVRGYEDYLKKFHNEKNVNEATPTDLEAFTIWYEDNEGESAKLQLWAIRYYYEFTSNKSMERKAAQLREERTATKRKAFRLKDFRGVDPEYIAKLENMGIRNVEQMRQRGQTKLQREELAQQTGIPIKVIMEFVKLSDLARLPGVKGIRARLYYEAGIDTVEKMAQWDPRELRMMLIEYVEKTGFDGIAPLPKEAESSVKTAKSLPKLIEY